MVIDKILELQNKVAQASGQGHCPVFVAGDVFHRHNEPIGFVNEVVNWFTGVNDWYAIPGNHDLPHHRYEDLRRSAYWSLVKMTNVQTLSPGRSYEFGSYAVTGWPYGIRPRPPRSGNTLMTQIALIHDFCYTTVPFPGVDPEKHADKWAARLAGYDLCFFGDNHDSFSHLTDDTEIVNVGNALNRTRTEKWHRNTVVTLHPGGRYSRVPLGVPGEWHDDPAETGQVDLTGLLDKLGGTHRPADYEARIRERAAALGKIAHSYLIEAVERSKEET